MMEKFRFLVLLTINVNVYDLKNIFIYSPKRDSKIFILFLRNEESKKGEEEAAHEEKSGNTIQAVHLKIFFIIIFFKQYICYELQQPH